MFRWLLQQLVQNPAAVFYERDLRSRFADAVDWAIESKLLWYAGRTTTFVGSDGQRRLSLELQDDTIAIVEDDPDVIFERPAASEMRRWEVDLLCLANRMHAASRFTGVPERIGPRLLTLGHMNTTYCVLVIADGAEVNALLDPPPNVLSSWHNVIAVVAGDLPNATADDALRRRSITCVALPPMADDDAASWEIATAVEEGVGGLRHADDFGWVAIGQHSFSLSGPRRAVVRRLVQASEMGQQAVPWAELKRIAEAAGANPNSMKDLMGSMAGWRHLVSPLGKTGWRLVEQS